MGVWPNVPTTESFALRGSEGELVSICIAVDPRDLEDLLEALATLSFPINPQLYHDAAVVYVERDGAEREQLATIVEFPAYADRLAKIRSVLEACGFGSNAVSVNSMLEEIHSAGLAGQSLAGVPHACRILRKRAVSAGGTH